MSPVKKLVLVIIFLVLVYGISAPFQNVSQPIYWGFLPAPVFYLPYHLSGISFGERDQPEGNILEDFHQNASETEHQYRPELGILRDADDYFHPRAGHLLHGHTLDFSIRVFLFNGL